MIALSPQELAASYRTMRLIRAFEEKIRELHGENRLPGFMHVSIGQEAVPAGVSLHLRDDDLITTTHRGHGDVIAKGAQIEDMFAELFARAEGLCRGKGGSMHVTDVSRGVLGANGIVAAGIPIAVGAALGLTKLGRDNVVVAYFGDGAIANGAAHEAMNMASLWNVPVLLVRVNNQYAESTPQAHYQGIPDVVAFAQAYGFRAEEVDGNDVEAVADAAGRATDRARAGQGPTFLECITYRHYGHNIGDPGAYRPAGEPEAWLERDPVVTLRARLVSNSVLSEEALAEIDRAIDERISAAVERADGLPEPPEEFALEDVYSDPETLSAFARSAA
jgi:TPP-dependent pyruvate/acetoin dehydrogenase alpha subunit